ncbi:MAG: NAD(P)-dependent oxidoreductase [bacterium]|nr:epimerase [Deltaproteobacteria bacterium]MCP4906112.1 NAD(P)-dependent oxidoreductase [bacterium]
MSSAPLEGEKILITGATGAAALPVARFLAARNEVWGAARFTDPALRGWLEDAGVHTATIDLEKNDLEAIPEDVSIILHYAYTRRPSGEFREATHVNAIAAGHVLKRCRHAKAALIVSAATLYSIHDDPFYAYREGDDIGFVRAPWGPSSPVSKVTLESTARFCAEAFDLPMTIVRPSVPYGLSIDVTTLILDSVLEDRPVFAAHDPQPYSPIHIDDMCEQIPALLDAASIPATILNWASDEIFTVQEMAQLAGEILGKTPTYQISNAPGVAKGGVVDTKRIREIVGPCKRVFREEFARICAMRNHA